jgi:hypothetical protein
MRTTLATIVALVATGAVQAGMPSFTAEQVGGTVYYLTENTTRGVQNLSFFLAGLLLSAWIVQRIWNGLRVDFTRLPRLSFSKALGIVGLWGVLFVLVLTMISGTRELMTPGAWKRQGATYRLADPPPDTASSAVDQ